MTKKLSIGAVNSSGSIFLVLWQMAKVSSAEAMVMPSSSEGMSFANAGFGLCSFYGSPTVRYITCHGVCCAMLLPVVERENVKRVPSFRNVARLWDSMLRGKQTTQNVLTMLLRVIGFCLKQ